MYNNIISYRSEYHNYYFHQWSVLCIVYAIQIGHGAMAKDKLFLAKITQSTYMVAIMIPYTRKYQTFSPIRVTGDNNIFLANFFSPKMK